MFRLWGKNCVKYHGFISMDGVSSLEEGVAAIFPLLIDERMSKLIAKYGWLI